MNRAVHRLGISMPILNQPYSIFPELAQVADAAGFDSLWDYEFYRNPFVIHGLCAPTTQNIVLGTGIAASVGRSPFEMANAALDVDELSNGRLLLGIGTGGAGWADCFHGNDVDKPVARISEYLDVVRMAWKHLATGEPGTFEGTYYRFAPPPVNIFGLRERIVRPRIPICISALRPKMTQLAGEKAEGFIGFVLTPEFIKEHILPNIAIGATRAGRNVAEVDVASLVICSVSDDRKEAMRRARIQVGFYIAHPVAEVVIDYLGLKEDRAAVLQALMTQGPAALEHTTSDALVKAFAIAGTPAECHEQIEPYRKVLTHVILHTPYMPPLTAAESEDAFHNIVRTFGRR